MDYQVAPIPVRPSTLNGISERMVVSHYENNYGNAVRTLNAVRRDLRGEGVRHFVPVGATEARVGSGAAEAAEVAEVSVRTAFP